MKDTNDYAEHRLDAAGLRLALFSGNYNYTRDGANQALNRLVGWLERHGAQVRVYSPTSPTPAFEPCGELVSVPSIPLPGRADYRLALGLPAAIREDVIRFRPSCIHLSAPDLLGVQAQKLARRIGVPVVASLHTRFETYLGYYGLAWLRRSAERFLQDFYTGCDRVLAPNAPLMELLRADGLGDKVSLWSRGVDRVQFSPQRRDLCWRRARGVGDEEVVVLFLGRLVMEKGLDVFAETLAQLRERRIPVRPVVIGDGPARAWLEARLPEGVFTGLLTGEELGRAVACADILLNPSRTEAFGNVTLEAMAAGLSVVCPQAPSTRELVEDGRTGTLVQDHEPQAYAAAIGSLVDDRARRAKLGAAACRASERYDWSNSSAAVLDVYRELGGVREPSCV
jgi:glycosyltransferase involved in cell wall biosynthesis